MAVNSTASSELQVELLPRLSRNLSHCCEKGLSAPGVGFSNFETNYLFFSSISRTKRLRMGSFWYDKWFCSFKNLSRVLPNLRSNAKVSFDGGGGARDQCGIPACAEEWLQTDSAVTSAVLLGLVFRCQWGKHEGFVKYFFRLIKKQWKREVIFFNFRQPPNTFHIHSSDRERTWPEAHCHVCDCRAFSTMIRKRLQILLSLKLHCWAINYLFLAIVVSSDDRSEGSTEVKRTPLTLSETRWRLDLSYPIICVTTTFSIEVDIPIWCTDLESFD